MCEHERIASFIIPESDRFFELGREWNPLEEQVYL